MEEKKETFIKPETINFLKTKTGKRFSEAFYKKGIPQYYYKYSEINSDLKNTLKENYFYFCPPDCFNDPYDCYTGLIDINAPLGDYQNFYKRAIINKTISENEEKRTLSDREKLRQFVKDSVSKYSQVVGICCFTRNENNFLMWSHYAKKHSGLVLKLKTSTFSGITFLDVCYTKEFIPLSFFKSPQESLMNMAYTKSTSWEYEEELRSVNLFNNDDERKVKFTPSILEEIVFGLKTDKKDIEDIIKIAQEKYPNVKFKKAHLKRDSFELEYKDFKI